MWRQRAAVGPKTPQIDWLISVEIRSASQESRVAQNHVIWGRQAQVA